MPSRHTGVENTRFVVQRSGARAGQALRAITTLVKSPKMAELTFKSQIFKILYT